VDPLLNDVDAILEKIKRKKESIKQVSRGVANDTLWSPKRPNPKKSHK